MGDGRFILLRADFDALLSALAQRGYTVIGPTVGDGAIVYGEVRTATDLPVGWTDEQAPGHYRLGRREDAALFGYAVGPQSYKQFQLPPSVRLWRARVDDRGGLVHVAATPDGVPPRRLAWLGARSCELHAAGILHRVLSGGAAPADPPFIVAVQCGEPAATCFCASMDTGPVARAGFDLALTEVLEPGRHHFVIQTGTERGAAVLADVPHTAASAPEQEAARAVHQRAAERMGRRLDTTDLKALLYGNYEHPRWQEVAERCLTCGNCTMVCPTCFCTTVEDVTDLTGRQVERHQRWDSCFTVDYSQLSGGPVRGSARSRYRQWMTHKLATWSDQFDSSGCVGCGRCITWCPVGIDITEEAAAIRADDHRPDREGMG